ncbi:ABC transporter permease [Streptomyces kanamyceticus]|uniref:ABC transporter permease subunit n=1 Tax=Streptomyces kanamyceticus TaxID=1967 RepID=A0A5J6GST6_STRKN|nr:ABC transporter permease subunit [Streptomyces kanamyceticus]QEU96056.1 ABC transporter permease subunit [Streptomyces kanamyceticus]
MSKLRQFPSRGAVRVARMRPVDLLVLLGVVAVFYCAARIGASADQPYDAAAPPVVSTDPGQLPYYAGRSLLRMFAGLVPAVLFTIVFGTWAARSRRAAKVIVPAIDILQSVPVLTFLSITVTGFIAMFPHSTIGLELASVFAVFTALVWNMAMAFYQSLTTQSRELDEAARLMRLTRWQRFWKVDVPSGMIAQVWNGMISFGAAWFALSASETISVNGKDNGLPGVGSYVAQALDNGQGGRVALAVVVMITMVVSVNFFFWRPITAWAERFRTEDCEIAEQPRSWFLNLLRRSTLPALLGRVLRPAGERLDRAMRVLGTSPGRLRHDPVRRRRADLVFHVLYAMAVGLIVWRAFAYILDNVPVGEIGHAAWLALITYGRVMALVVFATLVWVPIGAWIGMNPKVNRIAQPVVQVLASFPSNFLFPLAVVVLGASGISLNWGAIALMALGAQWYVLFNVIAGASSIPGDLREAADDLGLRGWLRWKRLILPAVFPSYTTGALTASGGAWNASIPGESVSYGTTTLTAVGIGAYITQATDSGDFARNFLGAVVMSVYVVVINRLVWRRLYRYAQNRCAL